MKQLMFIFLVFILFYIGPPLWERVDAVILRAELREALDYASSLNSVGLL